MRGILKQTPSVSKRPERDPARRALYERNKKIILTTQSVCGICGKPVDKSLKYPDPMSATVDHIIPVSRNGDPVSLDNLQLAHRYCNRQKGDNLPKEEVKKVDPNRDLPQSANWRTD
jgi:5-methylcytosine-specific restriction endonuclease McrA